MAMAKQKLNDEVLEEINGGTISLDENNMKLYYEDKIGYRTEYHVIDYNRAKIIIDYLKANQTEEEVIIAELKNRECIA